MNAMSVLFNGSTILSRQLIDTSSIPLIQEAFTRLNSSSKENQTVYLENVCVIWQ